MEKTESSRDCSMGWKGEGTWSRFLRRVSIMGRLVIYRTSLCFREFIYRPLTGRKGWRAKQCWSSDREQDLEVCRV